MHQCQRVLDLRGCTFKICNLLSFFISWAILRVLLLAGTPSERDGTARRFRGTSMAGCSHSCRGWAVFLVGAFSFKEKSPTITVGSFLVGAFSLKEKSPTITVGSFFSFSAYNLTLNGPHFTICSSVLLFIFD